ncbi:MAG: lysophospholipid acyltransferase family protein [Bacteroidales bacterium]|nr:lysophospholipid acyltransferase family protein [Bacteroidales bacterium]
MKTLLRLLYCIYQVIIAVPIVVLSTALTAITTGVGSTLFNAHFWGYWPGRIWSKIVCTTLLLPVHVEGREHIKAGQSYVFVANHQGSLDIFLIYGYLGRNFKWMMKKAIRKMPLVGFACERGQHIFVDKSGPKKIQETYEKARQTLRGGTSLVVFAEGARTFTGRMRPFRKGAFQLAEELHLPIIPITIDGAFEALPRTRGFGFVTWHPLRMVIHPPIEPNTNASSDTNTILKQTYTTIMSALPKEHQE